MSEIIGREIPQDIQDYLNSEKESFVLATINCETGYPHTTPVHLIKVPDSRKMFIAIAKAHQAYQNIQRDQRVMLSLLGEGDRALSIRGNAKIVRDPMEGNKFMAGIQIDVLELKSDTTPTVKVERGVQTAFRSSKTPEFFRAMFDELASLS
jgi:uncharacterized pyridoxamine 5'-phosphate oxidase family protein